MKVNFNHFEDISTVDYPGKSACVVFFNGCPWRCEYCHNKQTWADVNMVDIDMIKQKINSCLPYISAVVFSGGEPTMQPEPLQELCEYSKSMGLSVGIETNGYYPENLIYIQKYMDKIFLDIKAPVSKDSDYCSIAHNMRALTRIQTTLHLRLPTEIRIVDIDKSKTDSIVKSLDTRHKITILPYRKPQ